MFEINKVYYLKDDLCNGYYRIIECPKNIDCYSFIVAENVLDGVIEEFINNRSLNFEYRDLTDEEKLRLL
jgi:hypothetical protein